MSPQLWSVSCLNHLFIHTMSSLLPGFSMTLILPQSDPNCLARLHFKIFENSYFWVSTQLDTVYRVDSTYCHTRPRGKTYPIPKGIEGWAEEWYYIHQLTGQPASHPDCLTSQNIQSGITHQPLVGSSPNFKLQLREPNQN